MTKPTIEPCENPADRWDFNRETTHDGAEYRLIHHRRSDGHVSASGWYLHSRAEGIDRYWMGFTVKDAMERFQLEFIEGWKYVFGTGGTFERAGARKEYTDLKLDLRKRVAAGKRRVKDADA